MAKRKEVEPILAVSFEDYSRMRIFAKELWGLIETIGPESVFGYGYFERMAKELGIDTEGDAR